MLGYVSALLEYSFTYNDLTNLRRSARASGDLIGVR